ncbi:MAG TPA: D-alanyl-D-alanine carboxypeptidase family protein [Stellaceae bacterium]|nr:D-alanyl-D-alanine carboxypeptidase family protein [Stellaceae bacterium]
MSQRMLPRAAASLALTLLAVPALADPPTIDTSAQHAIIVDYNTGTVLFDKGADERLEPASLSKMMTAYVVFDYIKKGQVTLDDSLPVSERAWAKHKTNESNMFVALGSRVKVEDLIRGMIVQSGNDACYVLAEGLAGSESAFVDRMNEVAKQLGLDHSHFADVDGLPDPQEYTTARDLATLAHHLIADFPDYYHYESEKDFTYNGIKQGNRNPLLYKDIGVDGIKTGHTEEAGYGVAISGVRDGRRIIEILAGMKSMKERSSESEKLFEWAFREFADYHLVKAGDPVDDAPVWMGESTKVPATTASDVFVTLPKRARHDLKVMAEYDGAVKAPVQKGEPVGKLVISAPDMKPIEVQLVAAQPVDKLDALGRMATAAGYLLWGKR